MQYYNRYQRKKELIKTIISLAIIAAIFAVCITVRALGSPVKDDASSSLPPSSSQIPAPESSSQADSSIPEESSSEPEDSSVASTGAEATQPVDKSYFDDAVFIGNSRTEGLIMYNSLSLKNALTHKGLKVDTAFTDPCIDVNGTKMTVMDALAHKSFSKVYMMLGINELGWVYPEAFISGYGKMIDRIREINPQAVIYVQSVLPVTAKKSASDKIYNNPTIDKFNELLLELAKDKQVNFLNVAEAVADSDGTLQEALASDGVHLNREGCNAWMDYLKSHTAA
ncbi:MAG: hypothetical protein HFE85_01430 [Clostridiales bacterium]|nr:hypothetical protein [Clostridiales bacterium]